MPLGTTALSWIGIAALVLAIAALLLSMAALTRSRSPGRGRRPRTAHSPVLRRKRHPGQPLTLEEATSEIEALQLDAATALRHVAVVRYDAFGDMGGHLSWSLALLDDGGDGIVLTSIHGRSDSRTYAKNVTAWSASQQLSPEEQEAIGFARAAD